MSSISSAALSPVLGAEREANSLANNISNTGRQGGSVYSNQLGNSSPSEASVHSIESTQSSVPIQNVELTPDSTPTQDPPPSQNTQGHEATPTDKPTADQSKACTKPSWWLKAKESWAWETVSIIWAILCLIANIIILVYMSDKSLNSWNFVIGPNTLVGVFSTLSKAALVTTITECISQLKWLHFQESEKPLTDIQKFDLASRGPYGSLVFFSLLWRRDGGKAARWASLGCVVTVVALAFSPFTQQIISFKERMVEAQDGNGIASFAVADAYDNGNISMTGGWVEVTVGSVAQFVASLYFTMLNVSTAQSWAPSPHPKDPINNAVLGTIGILQMHEFNFGDSPDKALVDECRLYWCKTTYSAVTTFSNSSRFTPITHEPLLYDIQENGTAIIEKRDFRDYLSVSDRDGQKYLVNQVDLFGVMQMITTLFNATMSSQFSKRYDPGSGFNIASLLYRSQNVSDIFEHIAKSMTARLRSGSNTTMIVGQAWIPETYIHVQWAWFALPTALAVLTIVLLGVTILLNRRDGGWLWRSSVLPYMFIGRRWGVDGEESGRGVGSWRRLGGPLWCVTRSL
ncbi:hypothetical protein N0V90_007960 [Kalmusia sp. IMI 367209]|nr:hypothetical protein N0V90_007960 [Kalmusia sp. IMI 367209]